MSPYVIVVLIMYALVAECGTCGSGRLTEVDVVNVDPSVIVMVIFLYFVYF